MVEEHLGPVLRVAMPRAVRLYARGDTVHVVARCNNREFYCTYTLMSNHIHLLLQAPNIEALATLACCASDDLDPQHASVGTSTAKRSYDAVGCQRGVACPALGFECDTRQPPE